MNEFSKRTILAEGKTKFSRPSFLMHKSAGQEVAGAGVRETREAYGAIFTEANGTDHGQWFKTLREAVLKFNERNGTAGIVTDDALAAFQAQINQVTHRGV